MNYPTSATKETRWNFWRYTDGRFIDLDMDWLDGERQEIVEKICEHPHTITDEDGYEIYAITWPILTGKDIVTATGYGSVPEHKQNEYEEGMTDEAMHYYLFKKVWDYKYVVFHDLGFNTAESNVVFIEQYGDLLQFALLAKMSITYEV